MPSSATAAATVGRASDGAEPRTHCSATRPRPRPKGCSELLGLASAGPQLSGARPGQARPSGPRRERQGKNPCRGRMPPPSPWIYLPWDWAFRYECAFLVRGPGSLAECTFKGGGRGGPGSVFSQRRTRMTASLQLALWREGGSHRGPCFENIDTDGDADDEPAELDIASSSSSGVVSRCTEHRNDTAHLTPLSPSCWGPDFGHGRIWLEICPQELGSGGHG